MLKLLIHVLTIPVLHVCTNKIYQVSLLADFIKKSVAFLLIFIFNYHYDI